MFRAANLETSILLLLGTAHLTWISVVHLGASFVVMVLAVNLRALGGVR